VERTSGSIMAQNMVVPLLERGEIERVEEMLARDFVQGTLRVFRMYMTMTRVRVLAWRGRSAEAAERCANGCRRSRRPGCRSGSLVRPGR
jgi:hypothetical protein